MTLQVPYKTKPVFGTSPWLHHFQDDCSESGHWEHRPRRGKARWLWLGVMLGGGRDVSPLPYHRAEQACKPGTFNLQKFLPCFLALAVPVQPPGCKAGTCWARCTQRNSDWDSSAARQHRNNNMQPFSAQAPSYKLHSEESCRVIGKEEKFREGKKERKSKLASTEGQRD